MYYFINHAIWYNSFEIITLYCARNHAKISLYQSAPIIIIFVKRYTSWYFTASHAAFAIVGHSKVHLLCNSNIWFINIILRSVNSEFLRAPCLLLLRRSQLAERLHGDKQQCWIMLLFSNSFGKNLWQTLHFSGNISTIMFYVKISLSAVWNHNHWMSMSWINHSFPCYEYNGLAKVWIYLWISANNSDRSISLICLKRFLTA